MFLREPSHLIVLFMILGFFGAIAAAIVLLVIKLGKGNSQNQARPNQNPPSQDQN